MWYSLLYPPTSAPSRPPSTLPPTPSNTQMGGGCEEEGVICDYLCVLCVCVCVVRTAYAYIRFCMYMYDCTLYKWYLILYNRYASCLAIVYNFL